MIRILLVDDAPSFRVLLRHLVTEEGDITVAGEAGDIASGVALARELQPDVVVTDVHLGAENGLDAVEDLRAAAPTARIIALSGRSLADMQAEAAASGVDAYLEKDADARELRTVIRAQAARAEGA